LEKNPENACLQVDILSLRYVFAPLQWIGMNAMLVYVMAAEGIFEGFLNGWYYEGTNNTLVNKSYWISSVELTRACN
jgi:heparan-alpha-glucosaminide N-acetyltransferase